MKITQSIGMSNRTYYGEYTLIHWIKLMLTGNIVLPEYQRRFVWQERDVKRLIQSLKEGQFIQPVTIALYNDGTKKMNLILDGQQRLTSLLLAYLGYFPDKKKFEEGSADAIASEDDSVSERPSWMEVGGKAVDVADYSPLVLINPIVTAVAEKGTEFGSEGCLSFPQIFAEVKRPAVVDVVATNEKNEKIEFRCGGLLARCVQHECDHLQGVMFIDRMEYLDREENDEALRKLRTRTKERLKRKKY